MNQLHVFKAAHSQVEERQRTEIYAIIFYLKTFAGRRGAKRIPLFAENFLLKGGQGGTEGVGWSKKKKKIPFSPGFWGLLQNKIATVCWMLLLYVHGAGNPALSGLLCASLTLQKVAIMTQ